MLEQTKIMLKPPSSEGTQSDTIPSSLGTSLHFDPQLGANSYDIME
ncbi:hypothetical protein A2U01_0029527, partial [Trifolium medium]|nr:hypothetical protein [Trifolium medium]